MCYIIYFESKYIIPPLKTPLKNLGKGGRNRMVLPKKI